MYKYIKGECPTWEPQKDFPEVMIQDFQNKVLLNSFKDLICNPYTDDACTTNPVQRLVDKKDAVCGFKYRDKKCSQYSMITYDSKNTADIDGAFVSHTGACGLCRYYR